MTEQEQAIVDYATGMGNVAIGALNVLAKGQLYEAWSDKFFRNHAKRALAGFQDKVKDALAHWSGTEIPLSTLKKLGFKGWDEVPEGEPTLWLVPLWMVPCLPDGLELTSINDEKIVVGRDALDDDERFGCVSYGVLLRDEEDERDDQNDENRRTTG